MDRWARDRLIRLATLRQLQIFEMVARVGGFSKAAEALHLSQPTVSMQVRKLADALGVELFAREGGRSVLTPVGREVYRVAQRVLDSMDALSHTLAERRQEIAGPLRVAVVTTAKYFMPAMIGAFVRAHPQVRPRMTVTNRAAILERIEQERDDLYIMGQVPEGAGLEALSFMDNDLVPVGSTELAQTLGRLDLASFARLPMLVRESGSGTRLAMERHFQARGLKVKPYMELGCSEAIKQAVMANLGVAVVSLHNIRLELAGRHLALLDVEGFPIRRQWYVAHKTDARLSPVAAAFRTFLLEEAAVTTSPGRH